MGLTITEALAELKTINKRIQSKRAFVLQNTARHAVIRDPFEKNGSSQTAKVAEELQGIGDLVKRFIAIRQAISNVNGRAKITVEGVTHTVSEWLVWRREQSQGEGQLLAQMRQQIEQLRNDIIKKFGQPDTTGDERFSAVVNVDESELAKLIERHETVLGRLDGLLSLHNARTELEV